jgi:poly-gamma-glutamate system protein
MSMVTSLPGHLISKQTSANPNFAAVAVHYLKEAGARSGDHVAVGCTGSFPALNIAVLSAAETMGLKVSLISSAASSQFGANHPQQMWPEMEKRLAEEGVFATRSLAVSRGGFRDNAAGMTDETRAILDAAIDRSGRPHLQCASIDDSITHRMKLYADSAGDAGRFAAYINVGGGSASVGGTRGNDQLGSGLILPERLRQLDAPIDSVATRFLRSDVPVINMIHVVSLAQQHGLPVAPRARPTVGDGNVYASTRSSKTYAALGIVAILLSTYLIMRPPQWAARSLETISGGRLSLASGACWML